MAVTCLEQQVFRTVVVGDSHCLMQADHCVQLIEHAPVIALGGRAPTDQRQDEGSESELDVPEN